MRLVYGRKKGVMGVLICVDMMHSFRQKLHDNKMLLNYGIEELMKVWLANSSVIDIEEIDKKYSDYKKKTVGFSVTPKVCDDYRLAVLVNNLQSCSIINELIYLYLKGEVSIKPPEKNDFYIHYPEKKRNSCIKKEVKSKINLKNLYKKG